MNNNYPNLKPCPFCGTEPEYKGHSYEMVISCPQCQQVKVSSSWYDGDLGLTEACWNTRHNPVKDWNLLNEYHNQVIKQDEVIKKLVEVIKYTLEWSVLEASSFDKCYEALALVEEIEK